MLISFFRTSILYLMVVVAIRFTGKRQLGELSVTELVVTILIADLATVPMQDFGIPLVNGIVPIFTLVALEIILSVVTVKLPFMRHLIMGKSCIIIENGKILPEAIKKLRLSIDEIMEELRQKQVEKLSDVHIGIVEANGTLSIILNPPARPATFSAVNAAPDGRSLPITVIADGVVEKHNLQMLSFDEKWMYERMRENGCITLEEVYLMTADHLGNVSLQKKEPSQ